MASPAPVTPRTPPRWSIAGVDARGPRRVPSDARAPTPRCEAGPSVQAERSPREEPSDFGRSLRPGPEPRLSGSDAQRQELAPSVYAPKVRAPRPRRTVPRAAPR